MLLRQLLKTIINPSFTRTYARRPDIRPNSAGIRRQKAAIEDLHKVLDDPDDLAGLEGDFFQVHETHREYEREMKYNKKKTDLLIVRDKYFRERSRNFLTWAEKEQIRNLYKTDPEEWSFDRLSESFPATPDIIARVAKAKWTPDNLNSVEKHDDRVKKSWELFKANKLTDLPPAMNEHLRKFSHRNFDTTAQLKTSTDQVTFQLPKPKSTEFASIITSCDAYAEKHQHITDGRVENEKLLITSKNKDKELPRRPANDTYLSGEVVDREYKRFDQLSEAHDMMPAKDVSVKDLVKEGSTIDLSTTNSYDPMGGIQKYRTKQVKLAKSAEPNALQKQDIREKIRIPRKLYKKGSTYKFHDCYYDDDGEFLYRVPGMG